MKVYAVIQTQYKAQFTFVVLYRKNPLIQSNIMF